MQAEAAGDLIRIQNAGGRVSDGSVANGAHVGAARSSTAWKWISCSQTSWKSHYIKILFFLSPTTAFPVCFCLSSPCGLLVLESAGETGTRANKKCVCVSAAACPAQWEKKKVKRWPEQIWQEGIQNLQLKLMVCQFWWCKGEIFEERGVLTTLFSNHYILKAEIMAQW